MSVCVFACWFAVLVCGVSLFRQQRSECFNVMRFESMCCLAMRCDAMRVVGFRIVVSISAGVL